MDVEPELSSVLAIRQDTLTLASDLTALRTAFSVERPRRLLGSYYQPPGQDFRTLQISKPFLLLASSLSKLQLQALTATSMLIYIKRSSKLSVCEPLCAFYLHYVEKVS